MILLQAHKESESIDLGRTIRSILLVGSPPGIALFPPDIALLIATDVGGIVIWSPWETPRIESFVSDLSQPILGTTSGGWILAANPHKLELYRIDIAYRRIIRRGSCGPFGAKPIALLDMPAHDHFALLLSGGRMQTYQFQAPAAG